MDKKVLMLATTAAMIEQFNKNNILILEEMGYEVHVIGNWLKGNPISDDKLEEFKEWLSLHNGKWFHMPSTRKPLDINNIRAYKQVVDLIRNENYSFIHCHTPIGSVIGRLAAHKTNTKVVYTAHGFHFYKGAPLKNWFFYYPVEKFLSRWTDILITINHEDFKRATKSFNAGKTIKIPGIGIDTEAFSSCIVDKNKKLSELGLSDDLFLLLSVGELSLNKNQKIIIEALEKLKTLRTIDNITYLVVGKGNMETEYRKMIKKYGLESHIKLLGYRSDVMELCQVVECFIHPSIREGLGIAPLEAMASGLPLITTNSNGMRDYIVDGLTGICVKSSDVKGMANAIDKMRNDKEFRLKCGKYNQGRVREFDIRHTNRVMTNVYSSLSV